MGRRVNNIGRKIISTGMAVILFSSAAFPVQTDFWRERASAVKEFHSDSLARQAPPDVIIIQDIHNHQEAQVKIGRILEVLTASRSFLIGVEGAHGPFLQAEMHPLKKEEDNRAVADALLEEGLITGVSWFGIAKGISGGPIVGIDDPILYQLNSEAFLAAYPRQKVLLERQPSSLQEKLIRFEMTPRDWKEFQKTRIRLSRTVRAELAPFENFYKLVEQRDHAMAENLIRAMEERGQAQAIVVVGGFHSAGIIDRLEKEGLKCLVTVPNIDFSTIEGSSYLREFLPAEQTLVNARKIFRPAAPIPNFEPLAALSAFRRLVGAFGAEKPKIQKKSAPSFSWSLLTAVSIVSLCDIVMEKFELRPPVWALALIAIAIAFYYIAVDDGYAWFGWVSIAVGGGSFIIPQLAVPVYFLNLFLFWTGIMFFIWQSHSIFESEASTMPKSLRDQLKKREALIPRYVNELLKPTLTGDTLRAEALGIVLRYFFEIEAPKMSPKLRDHIKENKKKIIRRIHNKLRPYVVGGRLHPEAINLLLQHLFETYASKFPADLRAEFTARKEVVAQYVDEKLKPRFKVITRLHPDSVEIFLRSAVKRLRTIEGDEVPIELQPFLNKKYIDEYKGILRGRVLSFVKAWESLEGQRLIPLDSHDDTPTPFSNIKITYDIDGNNGHLSHYNRDSRVAYFTPGIIRQYLEGTPMDQARARIYIRHEITHGLGWGEMFALLSEYRVDFLRHRGWALIELFFAFANLPLLLREIHRCVFRASTVPLVKFRTASLIAAIMVLWGGPLANAASGHAPQPAIAAPLIAPVETDLIHLLPPIQPGRLRHFDRIDRLSGKSA